MVPAWLGKGNAPRFVFPSREATRGNMVLSRETVFGSEGRWGMNTIYFSDVPKMAETEFKPRSF